MIKHMVQTIRSNYLRALISNSFESLDELMEFFMANQQLGKFIMPCHFYNDKIIPIKDFNSIHKELMENGMLKRDKLNINKYYINRIEHHISKHNSQIFDYNCKVYYPPAIKREISIEGNVLFFNLSIDKALYNWVYGFPLTFDLYILFSSYMEGMKKGLSLFNNERTNLLLCSEAFEEYTSLSDYKRKLRKLYSKVVNFCYSYTKKKTFAYDILPQLLYPLLSSANTFSEIIYNNNTNNRRNYNYLHSVLETENLPPNFFVQYVIDHPIVHYWEIGKLHELYTYRIFEQSSYFDQILPCVTGIKTSSQKLLMKDETDLIAVKDNRIYIFEIKRTNDVQSSAIQKAISQIKTRQSFFHSLNIETRGLLITLCDQSEFKVNNETYYNITPEIIKDIIENKINLDILFEL